MTRSLPILAVLLGAGSAPAAPAFTPGEELTYRVRALGLDAGRARLAVGSAVEKDGVEAWPIVIWARTESLFEAIYSVHDKFVSFWDPEGGRLLGSELYQDEGGKRQRSRYRISDGKAQVQNEKEGAAPRQAEYPVPEDITDVTSALMSLRTHALEPGTSVELPVFLGSRVVTMQCAVEAREHITTPAGAFDTVRTRLLTGFSGKFASKRDLRIWFRDDASHVPVRLEADLVLGTLAIELVDAKKGVSFALSDP